MHRFELTANCSMDATGARRFFALVATGSVAVASVFVLQGFWPILPFAGLELAVLGWALFRHWQSAQAWESIEIDPEAVTITRFGSDGEISDSVKLARAWTRATLQKHGPILQLHLAEGRRRHAIGAFLIDDDKRQLQKRLSEILRHSGYNTADRSKESAAGR